MTRYRLLNASHALATEDVDQLVRYVFDATPEIDRLVAVKVADHPEGASGYATNLVPKWAGRATFALLANRPPEDWHRLGRPNLCWHATSLRSHYRGRYRELRLLHPDLDGPAVECLAEQEAYAWLAAEHAAGNTHVGRWPIYVVRTANEALVHTLAHEAWHVLALDRDRRTNRSSEIDAEEHALHVLTAYQEEMNHAEDTLTALA